VWGVASQISHIHLNSLLKILHPYHSELPLDSRTLLSTPREQNLRSVAPGEYFHFGIRNGIISSLAQSRKFVNNLTLNVLVGIRK